MTQISGGKFIQHPWATEADWEALNPTLINGEEGYAVVEVNGVTHLRKKVGPGKWNDLEYFDGVVWTDTDSVSSPIGDANGNLAGKTPIEILDLMLNQYQPPVVFGAINDAGTGITAETKTLEVGVNLINSVKVGYTVSNQENLDGASPILVTANGVFTNEGYFPVGPVTLSHNGIQPSGLYDINISIQADHINGQSNVAQTNIYFSPKIISAVSQTKILDGNSIMALPNKVYNITRDYTRDYSFGSAGHSVVCIPTMLNPTNLIFTDVTDPNLPGGYAMDDLGIMSINNGVGTYDYQVYASTYYLNNATILKIS